jgi:hypothetical protein
VSGDCLHDSGFVERIWIHPSEKVVVVVLTLGPSCEVLECIWLHSAAIGRIANIFKSAGRIARLNWMDCVFSQQDCAGDRHDRS